MKDANQPQTTNTPTVRDAAVQISDYNPYDKADAILEGALNIARTQNPLNDDRTHTYSAACKLAIILQNLTSPNKFDRERAKEKIREMVKLGEDATK